MAFFQNTKPNSIAGISLPEDGSDSMTIHFLHKNLAGNENITYEEDTEFFFSLTGAKQIDTSSGCMVEFARKFDILNALEAGIEFFDDAVISAIHRKRNHAQHDALRFRINTMGFRESQQPFEYATQTNADIKGSALPHMIFRNTGA